VHAEFKSPVQQVAGQSIHNENHYHHTEPPGPDESCEQVRDCPQCKRRTWALSQHCHYCRLDLWAYERRHQWAVTRRKLGFVIICIALLMMYGPIYVHAATSAAVADISLEQKLASIELGRWVDPKDTSIPRMRALVNQTAAVYRVTPIRAADMAVALKNVTAQNGSPVTLAETFDWLLIACEDVCSEKDLSANLAAYAAVRVRQKHHNAVHGLVILTYIAKQAAPRGK
jgi:hypothetical protein